MVDNSNCMPRSIIVVLEPFVLSGACSGYSQLFTNVVVSACWYSGKAMPPERGCCQHSVWPPTLHAGIVPIPRPPLLHWIWELAVDKHGILPGYCQKWSVLRMHQYCPICLLYVDLGHKGIFTKVIHHVSSIVHRWVGEVGILPTDGVIDAGIDRSMIMHYLSGVFFDITAMLLVSIYVWAGMKGEEVGYVPLAKLPTD